MNQHRHAIVIGGGLSSEHDVSVASARDISAALREAGYRVTELQLERDRRWTREDDPSFGGTLADAVAVLQTADVVVPALHGRQLVDAGVLQVRFERPDGRSGPGAGRPAKLYRPAAEELSATIPERHYDLAGSLLAEAVVESSRSGRPAAECLGEIAHAAGRQVGAQGASGPGEGAVVAALSGQGYEPQAGDGEIALANCPFHRLAEQQQDLVCGMNLAFVDGVLQGAAPDEGFLARSQRAPGFCCVRISSGGTTTAA
jgi:predicted ArsR family transcriptional regulator